MRVVLDTSVLVAATRSRRGASFTLVASIPSPKFEICLSVALYSEWHEVLSRSEHLLPGRTVEERCSASSSWLARLPALPRPERHGRFAGDPWPASFRLVV
jgi:predicted nucleic acid-binding protein